MKIYIPNDSEQSLGGGWTFRRNFIKGLAGKAEVVDSPEKADIVFITAPTMVTRDTVEKIHGMGKKFVLRLDNIPRNSRNRNTGTSRLFEFAQKASKIVYQSQWSKDYLMPFIKREGVVIHNGVDMEIFNPRGEKYDFHGEPTYLYSRFNRDETKRWEEAWYKFQMIFRKNPKAKLVIVGNFSDEQKEYNFDFFQGEQFDYLGIQDNPEEMAKIYRGCEFFLATYYNDCYSNTYQEALACGVKLFEPDMSGGTPELIEEGPIGIEQMVDKYLEVFKEAI